MAAPPTLVRAVGAWAGTSRLFLPFLPEGEQILTSETTLLVELDRQGAFAKIDYTWVQDGEIQDGSMLVAGSSKRDFVGMGWSDAWHQSGFPMNLVGTGMSDGPVSVLGSYPAEEGPDWGWRISFEFEGDAFVMRMFNIQPGAEEEWAVEAHYHRVAA